MNAKTNIRILLALLALILVADTHAAAPDEFQDGGFESSAPNGTFPNSGSWHRAWLGEAGSLCTSTAARSGHCGLWVYTGASREDWWSSAYQELKAQSGAIYQASGWLRTPVGSAWVLHSKASLRVTFVDAEDRELAVISTYPLELGSTDWTRHHLITPPAPQGTVAVRLICYLEKPINAEGQSIANFDDCYLGLASGAEIVKP